jgi:hypothetical protein
MLGAAINSVTGIDEGKRYMDVLCHKNQGNNGNPIYKNSMLWKV